MDRQLLRRANDGLVVAAVILGVVISIIAYAQIAGEIRFLILLPVMGGGAIFGAAVIYPLLLIITGSAIGFVIGSIAAAVTICLFAFLYNWVLWP